MTIGSNINPNFPVEGVNQSSQGFRDNFSTTKNEIENLQKKILQVTGDVTGNSDEVGNNATAFSLALALAATGVSAGTYAFPSSVTVDAKGRITSISAGSQSGGGGNGNSGSSLGLYINAIGFWHFDIADTPEIETRFDIDVARFNPDIDVAIYYDWIVPANIDANKPVQFKTKWALTQADALKYVVLGVDYQLNGDQKVFDFDDIDFVPDNSLNMASTGIQTLTWSFPVNEFQAGDLVSLRLGRYAQSDGESQGDVTNADNYPNGIDFFGASIEQ